MTLLYKIGSAFFYSLFYFIYRHKIYGQENLPKGAAIIAPNHQSYFDPPLIGISCLEEIFYLARDSLFKRPLLGPLIRLLNAYPLSGGSSDRGSLKSIQFLLAKQKKVVIFPEGVRSSNGNLSQIKPGITLLAFRSRAPIVPVYIHGTFHIWPRNRIFPKLWGKTACVFGHPFYPDQFAHLEKKEAQQALAEALIERISLLRTWYLQGAKGPIP
ncbi:MAG TPA: lysophospholipid acyltransferase family protein [Waddliaceae bacterium]